MAKDLRRLLLFFLIVVLPCGGFFLWRWLDDRAAERDWAEYVAAARSRGAKLTVDEFYVDPHLEDTDNYAASPLWTRAFAPGATASGIVPELPRPKKNKAGKTARSGINLADYQTAMAEEKWITAEQASLSEAEAVLAGLERYRPLFEELRSIRSRARAWYPVNWKKAYGAQFPHLGVIRNLHAALAVKARAELELGRPDEAFESLHDAFRMAASLDSAPNLITILMSNQIDLAILQELHAGLVREAWNDIHLEKFQNLLVSRNSLARLRGALAGERASFNSMIEPVAAELIGRIYVSKEDVEALSLPDWAATGRARWWRGNQKWANQAFDEEIAALDPESGTWKRPSHRSFDVEQLNESARGRLQLATLAVSPMSILRQRALFHHSVTQMAAIACALERHKRAHGRYPDDLQALQPTYLARLPADPTTQQPFHYRPQANTYSLYSAGMNGTDDGGTGDSFKENRDDPASSADWVWQ